MYSLKIRKWEIHYCNFNIRTCLAKITTKINLPTEVAGLHIVCGLKTIQPRTLQSFISNENTSTHRHFNPWYQDISTLTCSDISTHNLNSFNPYNYLFRPTTSKTSHSIHGRLYTDKKTPDIIPFAQICTGGQNPLYGFARVDKKPSWFAMVDKIPFMSLQGWTKSHSEHRKK